jgi:hypothetical protein
MRKGAVVVGLLLLSSLFPSAAFAQQYPKVGNIKPFSAAAHFMSLPGYLRYLTHLQTGQWLTYGEAARVVKQQMGQ